MRCPEGWERPGCTGAGLAEVPVRGQDSVRLGLWIRHGELPMRGVVGGDCRQKLGGGWGRVLAGPQHPQSGPGSSSRGHAGPGVRAMCT